MRSASKRKPTLRALMGRNSTSVPHPWPLDSVPSGHHFGTHVGGAGRRKWSPARRSLWDSAVEKPWRSSALLMMVGFGNLKTDLTTPRGLLQWASRSSPASSPGPQARLLVAPSPAVAHPAPVTRPRSCAPPAHTWTPGLSARSPCPVRQPCSANSRTPRTPERRRGRAQGAPGLRHREGARDNGRTYEVSWGRGGPFIVDPPWRGGSVASQ